MLNGIATIGQGCKTKAGKYVSQALTYTGTLQPQGDNRQPNDRATITVCLYEPRGLTFFGAEILFASNASSTPWLIYCI